MGVHSGSEVASEMNRAGNYRRNRSNVWSLILRYMPAGRMLVAYSRFSQGKAALVILHCFEIPHRIPEHDNWLFTKAHCIRRWEAASSRDLISGLLAYQFCLANQEWVTDRARSRWANYQSSPIRRIRDNWKPIPGLPDHWETNKTNKVSAFNNYALYTEI